MVDRTPVTSTTSRRMDTCFWSSDSGYTYNCIYVYI